MSKNTNKQLVPYRSPNRLRMTAELALDLAKWGYWTGISLLVIDGGGTAVFFWMIFNLVNNHTLLGYDQHHIPIYGRPIPYWIAMTLVSPLLGLVLILFMFFTLFSIDSGHYETIEQEMENRGIVVEKGNALLSPNSAWHFAITYFHE